jgi:hypothetical protein
LNCRNGVSTILLILVFLLPLPTLLPLPKPLPTPLPAPLPYIMALSLAPPPESIFKSVEDAFKALNTFTAAEGYAIIKRRSILLKRGVIRRVDLKYNKGSEVKPYVSTVLKERQRISSLRLINCPFSISCYLKKNN